jgi:hypothetical protein
MTTFTIVTGIVTLIGFFLQIKGLLPRYKKYHTAATFIFLGVTIGVLIASFAKVSINVPESLSIRGIVGLALFGGAGSLIVVCFTASTLIEDESHRGEVSRIGSAVSGFLIFLLMFFSSFFFPEAIADKKNVILLTYDEQVECGVSAAKKQNFERSLIILRDALKSVPYSDTRREKLSTLIEKVEKQQGDAHDGLMSPRE